MFDHRIILHPGVLYIGELLNDKQHEEIIGLDEYLCDLGEEDSFVIHVVKLGNIRTFVNLLIIIDRQIYML